MRVLIILNEADLGGANISAINMISAMKDVVDFHVFVNGHGEVENNLRDLGVNNHAIHFVRDFIEGEEISGYRDFVFEDNYDSAIEIVEYIKDHNIDIIHSNSSAGNVGAIAAALAGKPHVWHIRELVEDHYLAHYTDEGLKKRLLSSADKVIAISDCVKEYFWRKYKTNIERIYNYIEMSQKKPFHDENNLPYFLMAGNISVDKGQWDAIKAIESIKKDGLDNVRLYLVGHTNKRFEWIIRKYIEENFLEENIFLYPFQRDLESYRMLCPYSITASKMEALGRSTIEAMLFGQYVIGANTGGTLELVTPQEDRGSLYRQGDWKSLKESIENALMMSQQELAKKRSAAFDFATEKFGKEAYKSNMLRVYKEVLLNHVDNNCKEVLCKRIETIKGIKNSYSDETNMALVQQQNKMEEDWRFYKENNLSISDYLKINRYFNIAIYGMGRWGCELYDELDRHGVNIVYVMDQRREMIEEVVRVEEIGHKMESIDLVIVAMIKDEAAMIKQLQDAGYNNVKGITEVMNSNFAR